VGENAEWEYRVHQTCGIHLMGGRCAVPKYRSLVKKGTAVNLKAFLLQCCSSLRQRPLHTCHNPVWSRELALCIQSNSLVPRAWTAAGQRSLAVNGPTTWNSLPPALQASELSQNEHFHTCTVDAPVLDRPTSLRRFLRDFGAEYKCTD